MSSAVELAAPIILLVSSLMPVTAVVTKLNNTLATNKSAKKTE